MKQVLLSIIFLGASLFAEGLTLRSKHINGQLGMDQVFNGFGCTGKNISPELNWSNAPKGTKSFALTMYDPDAPTGSGWWHWLAFNISKDTTSISADASAKGTLPEGTVESMTDYGKAGFGGACPPVGDKAHQYLLTIHALDTDKLNLDANANPALVGYMIGAHTIEKSSVVGYYKR